MAFLRVKCDLQGDIRRFCLDEPLVFHELKKHLETIYAVGELVIKYKDDEDDLVTIAAEADLAEARTLLAKDPLWRFKLFVKETPKKEKKETSVPNKDEKLEPLWLLKQFKKTQKAQWKEVKQVSKDALKPWKAQAEKVGNPVKAMARFVSHVTLVEGETIPKGSQCTKTWRVRNDSPRTWPEGPIQLVYVSGKSADRLSPEDAYPVEASMLAPGEEVDLSVEITAPTKPGFYQGFWRLQGSKGNKFGQRLGCSVLVKDDFNEAVVSDSDPDASEEDVVSSENDDSDGLDGFVDVGKDDKPHEKWLQELAVLKQAGFDNDKLSLKMLKKCKGNVSKTAKKLAKKNLACVKKVTKTAKKLEDLTMKQAKLFPPSDAAPPPPDAAEPPLAPLFEK